MYFNVYNDSGSVIEGYLIPDGFSAKPSICVLLNGGLVGPIPCSIFLASPFEHKHHETGVVGFKLDEGMLPNLAITQDLAIADAETGFVFYRRFNARLHLIKKVFRLETQFSPHKELDNSLKPYFQFFASGAELYGSETVRQMLEIVNQPSSYVSGRVMLKGVQRYLTEETVKIASLRDPFYELALRIWSVAACRRRHLPFFSERDKILYGSAIDYFSNTDFANMDAAVSEVRNAPREVLSLFESPFTHQLVAANPSDKVGRDGISSALDALSQFTLFDAAEEDARLAIDVAETLGLDPASLSFSSVRMPILQFADALREVKILEQVLETDLILFHFIRQAAKRAQK